MKPEWVPARTTKHYTCIRCGSRAKLLVKGFNYILLCKSDKCLYIDLDIRLLV